MANCYRRLRKDGTLAKKYTIAWKDAYGEWHTKVAYADKAASEALRVKLESEAAMVRDGVIREAEVSRRDASRRPLADHIEDYRRHLLAKGGTIAHARHVSRVLARLMDDAGITMIGQITPDRIQGAVARLRQARSPRTCNHAIGAAKAFATWLVDNSRLESHRLKTLETYSQAVDRTRERRALTPDEVRRLLAAARSAPTLDRLAPTPDPSRPKRRGGEGLKGRGRVHPVTGEDRYWLYRVALETGFRADEIRSLTRESFRLDAEPPVIVCEAAATKNGQRADQQVRKSFAAELSPWLATRPESGPALNVPEKTAKLLRIDLATAGIPYRDDKGHVADFHSLRATYITNLIRGGADVGVAQKLARHSDPKLTMNIYAKADARDKGSALDNLPE